MLLFAVAATAATDFADAAVAAAVLVATESVLFLPVRFHPLLYVDIVRVLCRDNQFSTRRIRFAKRLIRFANG